MSVMGEEVTKRRSMTHKKNVWTSHHKIMVSGCKVVEKIMETPSNLQSRLTADGSKIKFRMVRGKMWSRETQISIRFCKPGYFSRMNFTQSHIGSHLYPQLLFFRNRLSCGNRS